MATAYTVLLGRALGTTGQDVLLFSVGSVQAVIVRDIVATNTGSSTAPIHIYAATGQGNFHLAVLEFAPLESVHLELRQRLGPGDLVRAFSDVEAWNVSVTGYLLGLEPTGAPY